jgi:hypothetical protein
VLRKSIARTANACHSIACCGKTCLNINNRVLNLFYHPHLHNTGDAIYRCAHWLLTVSAGFLSVKGFVFLGGPLCLIASFDSNTAVMKAATERKIIRWFHILISIPVVGLIYGPVKDFPHAVFAIKWIFFPAIVLSGLWLWKGHLVRKKFSKKRVAVGS